MTNKQSKHSTKIKTDNKHANNKHNHIMGRNNVVGTVIGLLSGIAFAFNAPYVGALVILVSCGIILYNQIKTSILVIILILLFLSITFYSLLYNNKKTSISSINQINSNDSTRHSTILDTTIKPIINDLIQSNKKAIDIQNQIKKISTRAYMSLRSVGPFTFSVGKDLRLSYVLFNSGDTPAYNIKHKVAVKIGTGVYQTDIDWLNNYPITNDGFVGSKQQIKMTFSNNMFEKTMTITQEDSLRVFSGKKTVYLFGKIFYDDSYKIHHTLCICVKFIPPQDWRIIYEDPDCSDETKIKCRQ